MRTADETGKESDRRSSRQQKYVPSLWDHFVDWAGRTIRFTVRVLEFFKYLFWFWRI